jgi:peptidyl-prolyl cis-trans isomerase SurA
VAVVNGFPILLAELDQSVARQLAGSPQRLEPLEEQALRLSLLGQMIERRLQLERAEKLGIAASSAEVNKKLSEAQAPYTKEQFQKILKDLKFTEEEYKQELGVSLTIAKLLDREISAKVMIADADLASYYNQHKSEFNLTETRYYFAQILVRNRPGAPLSPVPYPAQNDQQALRKITLVRNRLEAGEDFATLASRYSEDEDSRSNGGQLEPVPESQLRRTDPATRQAILKLRPGGLSSIIRVIDPQTGQGVGYRIISMIKKEPPGQRELTDPAVHQWIRSHLREAEEHVLKAAYHDVLYNGARIHNYYAEQLLERGSKAQ